MDAVDDFRDVLAVIQVDCLEAKDLARRKVRNGQPRQSGLDGELMAGADLPPAA